MKKTLDPLTRTLKFININFDEYEDDDDKSTKKLDYCAHETVSKLYDNFQLYFRPLFPFREFTTRNIKTDK